MLVPISWLANTINEYCERFEYFQAVGLIKETINVWKIKDNYNLLEDRAKAMTDHYLTEV